MSWCHPGPVVSDVAALRTYEDKQNKPKKTHAQTPSQNLTNFENTFSSSLWAQWLDTKFASPSSPSFGHQTDLELWYHAREFINLFEDSVLPIL